MLQYPSSINWFIWKRQGYRLYHGELYAALKNRVIANALEISPKLNYVQPNIQTSKVFHLASQLPGALSYHLCSKQKSVMSCFWKENVFLFLWWFLAILPMHALISLLAAKQKAFGNWFYSKFPDYTLPKYKHCEDTKPYTSFCWVVSDSQHEKSLAWWSHVGLCFWVGRKIFLFDWEDLMLKLLWN